MYGQKCHFASKFGCSGMTPAKVFGAAGDARAHMNIFL
jgi:hypothetical protein